MHTDDSLRSALAQTLQYKLENFPLTYLGLPLSLSKLRTCDLQPTIAKADKFLAGWQAKLLSYAERIILVNAVLDSLPIYAMAASKLPKGSIEAFDKKRRSFLWSGEDSCSGAKCLVAWKDVCTPKQSGGLGIKNMELQNNALLIKRLNHLHSTPSSWANWIWQEFEDSSIFTDKRLGPHWDSLMPLMPELQKLSSVQIGNGKRSSFWLDMWSDEGILAEKFQPLFSHALDQSATVAQVCNGAFSEHFAPRLSSASQAQVDELLMIRQNTCLNSEQDSRVARGTTRILRTKEIYQALSANNVCPNWLFVWRNRAPPKAQFFAWLLSKERLPTKANLCKKGIVQSALCPICLSAEETAAHLSFLYPFATAFWNQLEIPQTINSTSDLHALRPNGRLPTKHFKVFFLLCLWGFWNHRHDVVFRGEPPSLHRLVARCIEDATLWAERLICADRIVVESWKQILSSPLHTM